MSTNVKSKTKNVTKSTVKKKVENFEKVPRLSRSSKNTILDELFFGMNSSERTVLEQKKAVSNVKYSDDVKNVISSLTKMTLTDHEVKLDYAKIKLVAAPYELTLDNGVEYKLYCSRLSDFSVFCTRNNARSMETGSKLSKTATSFLKSSLTAPEEIIWNSTKFNIVCDEVSEPFMEADGLYIELRGDIQIRDGGNRAVTIEMLKRYAQMNDAGFIPDSLYFALQEFVVRKRGTFPDEKTSINACINANNSTAHSDVEILRCCGVFDEVIERSGKYKDTMVAREADKAEGKILVENFLEDAGCFDNSAYYTEGNKIYLKSKDNKDSTIGLHCVKTYLNGTRVKNIYTVYQNDDFNFDTWFTFMKRQDTAETLIELHLYLENEFFNDLTERVNREENPLPQEYLTVLKAGKRKGWNKASRRYLLNALKVFEAEDSNGDIYFCYSPKEALKNEEFLRHILDKISYETSADKVSGDRSISSVDGRDTRIADKIYKEAKHYAGVDLKVYIK